MLILFPEFNSFSLGERGLTKAQKGPKAGDLYKKHRFQGLKKTDRISTSGEARIFFKTP